MSLFLVASLGLGPALLADPAVWPARGRDRRASGVPPLRAPLLL